MSALTETKELRLTLSARAANVPIVRRVVAGLGDALLLDPALVADMNIAVSEACTNVVRHAYESDGPMVVEIQPTGSSVTFVVGDLGRGIAPTPPQLDPDALGVGLAL